MKNEAQLRTFFMEGDVPGHLLRYKDLFVYQQLQQEEHLGADFDVRVLAEIEAPVVKARRMTADRTLHAVVQSRSSSGGGAFIG